MAVAEFPVQAEAVAEFPVQAEAVVAVAEFPVQAEAVVAVAEFPVHELEDPLAFPVKLPVTFPETPPLAVIKPLALIVVKLAEDAVVAPIVALLIVPPEITGLVRVLFVSVSVVALPTRVSVEVGSVIVPVLDIELMIGVVRVLLVSVWVSVVVTSVFVAGIVVPLIVDVAVIAPVTARVPLIVALPPIGKSDVVPPLTMFDGVTFFSETAEESYIKTKSFIGSTVASEDLLVIMSG